ncbi:MAG: SGNH/GDSL hydrolase family protein [Candidatus Aenigmarchaeota archaeon]|nr:SGNH/GDSL hydrolase family protein [Candidatus Aenigmarchaeota archaeon]
MNTKKRIINISISIVTILIVLVIFEITIRLIYGNHLAYDVDKELYWKLKPDQRGYQILGFSKATINSQGFRGEELEDKSFNIFMLGGSYTFGQDVEDNETFPHLLGKRLEIYENTQVINLGVPGWGLFQENITLHRNYETYKPRLVILTLTEPDFVKLKFDDKTKEKEYLTRAEIRTYFREISFLSFLKQKIGFIFATNFGATENYVRGVSTEVLWPKNMVELDSIYNFTMERNITFVLVMYPKLEADNKKFYNLVMNYTEDKQIILINDLDLKFNAFKPEKLMVEGKGHPSPLAHEIVAERIFSELENRGIINEIE